MAIALLLGNGVNRLNNDGASWEHLLKTLATSGNRERELEYVKQKPFALLYEEIFLKTSPSESAKDEMALKRRIADLISNLRQNEFHRRFMQADVRHILTTNYDYNLEMASGLGHSRANLAAESKYSVFRRRAVGDKYVWHIHGEKGAPSTITLGYDQYCGYLQKLRAYATAERNLDNGSPFKLQDLSFDEHKGRRYSWLDVFFRDDVHIIGLTLDFTEIDLWWVLTYKARLRARGFKVGSTCFHDWHAGEADEDLRAKHSLLASLGVRVELTRVSTGYETAYDSFLHDILGV